MKSIFLFFKRRPAYYALAFLLSVIIVCVCFAVRGIAPFGDHSLMAIDAWGQYFPMLRETRRAVRTGNFYSFSGGLGYNIIPQSAYYTNSPLWLPLYLMPWEITPTSVDIIVILRFGLSGLSFAVWLSEKFRERNVGILAVSCAYSLSGWTLAFINQFMWHDAYWLLPLVILGIERQYHIKKSGLYLTALSVTIFSNFYIAYMVCIFCVIWFIVTVVTAKKDIKYNTAAFARFSLFSLLSGAINSPVLLCTARALSHTKAAGITFHDGLEFYHSIPDFLAMLLPFRKDSIEYGPANLYCGIICAVFAVGALFSKKYHTRAKITYATVTLFLLLSFDLNILDYMWHGFHFPNQLPARQSFLFVFVVLTSSYCGMKAFSGLFQKKRVLITGILSLVITAEITANSVFAFCTYVRTNNGSVNALDNVFSGTSGLSESVLRPQDHANEFYRTELYSYRDNGGLLYGYNGISYYSSTMSSQAYDFFCKLGLPIYAESVSTRYDPDPILNSLFGVKYIVYASNGQVQLIMENATWFPLAFIADSIDINHSLRDKALRNDLIQKVTGDKEIIRFDGGVNDERLVKAAEEKREHGLVISSIDCFGIKGTIETETNGIMLITLPYYDIEVLVNGRKAEITPLLGYLAAVNVDEGVNNIEIHFI